MAESFKYIENDDSIRRLDVRKILLGIFAFAVAGTIAYNVSRDASAANFSKFQPGYLLSDYVMTDYNSMDTAAIQKFLKSKNPCNGDASDIAEVRKKYPNTQWNVKNGKYVCMADDTFYNKDTKKYMTAAEVINFAAKEYKINPRVLIVLLQKEQGLVTDLAPNSVQYRSATGYGCPDNAPCDEAYYGFYNQVTNAAALFRYVMDGYSTKYYPAGKTVSILYHPYNDCGSQSVTIKNRATSALYRYTPYVPNKAALNAYPGTGDQCSSYGNRNFVGYYQDWFGDPLAEKASTTTTTNNNTGGTSTTTNGNGTTNSGGTSSDASNASQTTTSAGNDKNPLTTLAVAKGYAVESGVISGINPGDTLDTINKKLGVTATSSTKAIGTGTVLTYNGEKATVVIKGDLTGDGIIDALDLLRMKQHLVGTKTLTGAYKTAASIANGKTVDALDLLRMKQHLVGTKKIAQK
ncbi:MAG: dockerin type I repeat-containing protein [Candidatus Saccharibacteria bacterium]|nr:dockerin type I repeat-containing protein [Candidatus Saccharibacteria bacterium]